MAGLASLALLGASCHRTVSPKEKVSVPPARRDTTRVIPPVKDTRRKEVDLSDTTLVTVTFAGARNFNIENASQRDSFLALLKKERQLWQDSRPRDYRFLLRVGCFCPDTRGWLVMEVRGRELRAWDRTGKPVSLNDWNTFSIDGLFDMLERSVDHYASVRIGFDPRWHFPANIRETRPGPDTWGIIEARGLRAL